MTGQFTRFGDKPPTEDDIEDGEFHSSLLFEALNDSVPQGTLPLVLNFYSDKTALDAL